MKRSCLLILRSNSPVSLPSLQFCSVAVTGKDQKSYILILSSLVFSLLHSSPFPISLSPSSYFTFFLGIVVFRYYCHFFPFLCVQGFPCSFGLSPDLEQGFYLPFSVPLFRHVSNHTMLMQGDYVGGKEYTF